MRSWAAVAGALACALVLASSIAACGDDSEDPPATPDGGAPDGAIEVPDAGEGGGGPLTGGEYSDPSDFDRVGCEAGSLAGLDPLGVWHSDVTIEYFGATFSYPDVYKLEPHWWNEGAYMARIWGRVTDEVELTDDYLFMRRVTTTSWGALQIDAYFLCGLEPDGTLTGKMATCSSDLAEQPCTRGTIRSTRVETIAGEQEAMGLGLVGQWNGEPTRPWMDGITTNVRVVGDVAYLSRRSDGLRSIDISDPAAMRDLGWYYGDWNDLKMVARADGRLYAIGGSESETIASVDVTDPTNPALAAVFVSDLGPARAHTLFTETIGGTTRAYLAENAGLQVWDVTDPAAPQLLGLWAHPDGGGYLHDLFVKGGIVYLNHWSLGLVIVDATDPAAIAPLGTYDAYERRTSHSSWVTEVDGCEIAVVGDEDFGAHVHIVGVDPDCPDTWLTRIGEYQTRPEVSVHNIMAVGDKAYVTWYQDGVRVLDLSDPTQPALEAYAQTWSPQRYDAGWSFYEGAIGIDVDPAASRIYVADTLNGLMIFELTP